MVPVQLQHPALDHPGGDVLAADTEEVLPGAADLHHELHIALQRIRLIGVLPEQKVKVDIVLDELSVTIHLIHPHPASVPVRSRLVTGGGGRGKDRWVSIAPLSFFLLSLIRGGKTALLTAFFQRSRLRKNRSLRGSLSQRLWSRLLIFRSLRSLRHGEGRHGKPWLWGLAGSRRQDEVLDVDAGGAALALLAALDEADAVQLPEQLGGLVLAAAQHGHGVLLGEVDVDAPVAVQPPVADGQAHAVQHEAVEDLGLDGHALVAAVCQQGLGDAVEAVLLRLAAVVVIQF